MNVYFFLCLLSLFHSEQDERASGFVFVVPAAVGFASGCLSSPRPSEFIAVAFSARRQQNGRRMNGPWGWKCAGCHSYRRVQSTVSYIGVIVFLSASISSYVTCWERWVVSRYVWVVGHKRFCCLMPLVWKWGTLSSSSSDHSHVFLSLIYFLIIYWWLNLLYLNQSVSVGWRYSLVYFQFTSSTCLYSTHLWKQWQKNNFWTQNTTIKCWNSHCLLFVCLFF